MLLRFDLAPSGLDHARLKELFRALRGIRTPNLLIRSQIRLSAVHAREGLGQPEAKRAKLDALEMPWYGPFV